MSELIFHDYYAPMLNWGIGPTGPLGLRFKPCSALLVCIFGSLGGWLIAEALTLSTPDEAPVWFPADHMVTGLPDIMRTSFLSGEYTGALSHTQCPHRGSHTALSTPMPL